MLSTLMSHPMNLPSPHAANKFGGAYKITRPLPQQQHEALLQQVSWKLGNYSVRVAGQAPDERIYIVRSTEDEQLEGLLDKQQIPFIKLPTNMYDRIYEDPQASWDRFLAYKRGALEALATSPEGDGDAICPEELANKKATLEALYKKSTPTANPIGRWVLTLLKSLFKNNGQ